MEEKLIKIKVTSARGHDEFEFLPNDAIEFVRNQCQGTGKVLYMDTLMKNPNDVQISDLLGAEDITITNGLKGGSY